MEMRINYSQVMQQAGQIAEEARRISVSINQLEEMINQTAAAWKGPASTTFIRKCQELKQEMQQTHKKTSQLASTIQMIANKLRQADEDEAKLANQLKSN